MNNNNNYKKISLYVPKLEDICNCIKIGLNNNYELFNVDIINCPNLKDKYNLPSNGICGNCDIIDLGGELNVFYPENHQRYFKLNDIAEIINRPNSLYIGAGACSSRCTGINGELAICEISNNGPKSSMWSGIINDQPIANKYEHSEIGLLANMMVCDGNIGEVIRIRCTQRKGDMNLVSCIRQSLLDHIVCNNKKRHMSLCGYIRVLDGKIRSHVMSDFVDHILEPGPQINEWLQFFEMGPHLNCLSVMITGDPTEDDSLHLRYEHTHFFSDDGKEVGHYHFTTTPKEISYECYFVPCENLHRIHDPANIIK